MIEQRLLRTKDVMEKTNFSRPKLKMLMKNNQFPKNIKIGGATVWHSDDVSFWLLLQKYKGTHGADVCINWMQSK